jgi:hypothetical protein
LQFVKANRVGNVCNFGSLPGHDRKSFDGTAETIMTRFLLIAAALAFAGGPALAQTGNGTTTAPSAQNSGTGIAGQPGNKNGPAPKSTTGTSSEQNAHAKAQDVSKIPGKPGGKSGPAERPPANSTTK